MMTESVTVTDPTPLLIVQNATLFRCRRCQSPLGAISRKRLYLIARVGDKRYMSRVSIESNVTLLCPCGEYTKWHLGKIEKQQAT